MRRHQIAHENRNLSIVAAALSSDNDNAQSVVCPITRHPCVGDLSHLCKDYGCARKGGLSPHSEENF